MKRFCSYLLPGIIVLLSAACNPKATKNPLYLYKEISKKVPENSLSVQEKKNGWELLFDGKTFNGWHGYNMEGIPDSWIVENNALTMITVGGGESQDIITDRTFGSFALSLEFKLSPESNSGIIFQVKEDTIYSYPYETGPEFQVIDHKNWTNPIEDWQKCGANYAMYPPLTDASIPVGEWNHAFLMVKGNEVFQLLNDKKVVEYTKYSPEWDSLRYSGKWNDYPDYGKYDTGHISLQNHGSKVWYRNIKIKIL